jgi:outer membrane protein TolC
MTIPLSIIQRTALAMTLLAAPLAAQNIDTGPPIQLVHPEGAAAPPAVVTLQDALELANKNDAQFQSVVTEALIAREDRVQAKSTLLPSVSHSTQYLGTQGNGVAPSGRYVTNDGVHVYRSWGILRQEISPNAVLLTGYKRAQAAEALAAAKVEVAQRGLVVTVTKDYYALVASQRRYATAQQAAQQAMRFLEIAQQSERLGQVAHSDAVKAEIQYEQQRQSYQEATLAMENARLSLAVLIFPALNENFSVVDDLDSARVLPPFSEIQAIAERQNPDLRAAQQALRQSSLDVRAAQNAFLPSLAIDANYGIEANAFASRSKVAAAPQYGPLPNLGYYLVANLTLPLWDWGTLRSKLHQAQARQQQAQLQLTQTQRLLVGNLYSYYNEASAARVAVDGLRHAADLAAESLRLINLRYQAGESTALEVVDAQNTFVQARNAYDDAQTRYRVAVATLQTVTGNF